MTKFENLIRISAICLGGVALLASTISAILLSRQERGSSLGRGGIFRSGLSVFIITIVLVIVGILLWKPIPIQPSASTLFCITSVGAIFYFSGIGLYLWGLGTMRSQFGVSSLFGAHLYKEHRLVTKGPFALVRHPLYIGVILTAIGALFIFRTWAMVLFTPMSLVVIGRAEKEERLLAQEFVEEWNAYAAKVPKWIPRL